MKDRHKWLFCDIVYGNFVVVAQGILETKNTGIWDATRPEVKQVIEEAFKTGKKVRTLVAEDYKQLFGEDMENLPEIER